MSVETRRKAHRKGHRAEWRAAWRLRLAGYTIVAQRYKTRLGEIDIVARRGNLLVFVEVQHGDYFGEDDIVRLEDDYGRTDA